MNEPQKSQQPQSGDPTSNPPATVAKSPTFRFWLSRSLVILAFFILLGIALDFYLPSFYEAETDDAYVEAHVVSVIPKVSAYVFKLYFDDNAKVREGELLVELDPKDYLAAISIARANFAEAKNKLTEAQAQVSVADANAGEAGASLGVAQASATLAEEDLKRLRAVSDSRAVSDERLDQAKAAADGTMAAVDAATMKVMATASERELAQAQVKAVESSVEQAGALLDQAELNLTYTKICAPISGTITSRDVEKGNYVQPGQLIFSIVPDELYVVANYKETQIERMRLHQAVVVRVDAFPGIKLRGHVDSIQRGTGSRFALLPPENSTGNFVKVVQRVPVKIVFDQFPANVPFLSPGMSVETRVHFH
jgi:membrane fusion protein (multidrug efflux system)